MTVLIKKTTTEPLVIVDCDANVKIKELPPHTGDIPDNVGGGAAPL